MNTLQNEGFVLVPGILAPSRIAALIALFEHGEMERATRGEATFGARNLLGLPLVREAAGALAPHLEPLLGTGHRAVRGLFFDKTPEANWPVLWHQDLSLAVRERHDIAGWNNWSIKRGVPHVQPPAAILERMLTVRLHLDDCGKDNGPLRLIPGSHAAGILGRDAITAQTNGRGRTVLAKAGDGLFMRPLILHASSPAARPGHRRILHLEFAPAGLLPDGLHWA